MTRSALFVAALAAVFSALGPGSGPASAPSPAMPPTLSPARSPTTSPATGPAGAGLAVWSSPGGSGPAGGEVGPRVVVYHPPLAGALVVLRGFTPPATRYGPGHLGVDLRAGPGVPVLSAGAGVVTFAGSVAGRGVVVVLHADGIRTEYEPVRPLVRRGGVVAAGTRLGTVVGRHRGCAGPCLHWGARRGEVYLDPLSLLRPLGPVRLLPWGRAGPAG